MHQPDALKAAEDTLFLKQIIRNVARRHGYLATFMAKPYADKAGSGLHIHFSMLDESGRNVFDDGTDKGSDIIARGGRGAHGQHGRCDTDLCAASQFLPTPLAGGPRANTVGWGYENRTAAIRIPGGPNAAPRIEHRVAGSTPTRFSCSLPFSAAHSTALPAC